MEFLELIIGNQNYSSWSLRPWLFLRHHGIPFTTTKVLLFTDHTERDLAPYFSDSKVPVLRHGGLEVWDTLAILEYLAELFPDKCGWPLDSEARAVARSICAEMHSSLFALRGALPMNCRRRFIDVRLEDDVRRDIQRVSAIWRRCRENYGASGPWLFGEFSIADCMYAPVVLRFKGYGVELDGVGSGYVETSVSSPAMQAWIRAGCAEQEIIDEDEAPWPSEAADWSVYAG